MIGRHALSSMPYTINTFHTGGTRNAACQRHEEVPPDSAVDFGNLVFNRVNFTELLLKQKERLSAVLKQHNPGQILRFAPTFSYALTYAW